MQPIPEPASGRGLPDVLAWMAGRLWWVELKGPDTRLEDEQRQVLDAVSSVYGNVMEVAVVWPADWAWFRPYVEDAAQSYWRMGKLAVWASGEDFEGRWPLALLGAW